jgi:hypothetical protein
LSTWYSHDYIPILFTVKITPGACGIVLPTGGMLVIAVLPRTLVHAKDKTSLAAHV